jgi:uncharacterized protein (DUF4415 family)
MNRHPDPERIDRDNPEWTEDDLRRALRVEQLPEGLQAKLRAVRGPQKAPTKERVTIRLSRDVVARFRATGPGWQTRMDAVLKNWLRDHSPE